MSKKNLLKFSAVLGTAAFGLAAASTVANADTIYTVKAGDTLSGISQKFGKDSSMVDDLAKNNNIKDINMIHVGDKLVIKDNGTIKEATKADLKNTNKNNPQPAQTSTTTSSNLSASDAAAKAWIAQHESSGSYTAQNGRYYGKYQLDLAYLGGDLSPQHQEQVADQYVASRYGSWTAAQAHWMANGWY